MDESWHRQAAGLLRQHTGPVVVSGYASSLYTAEYERHGWQRVERQHRTNSGGERVECLWLNSAVIDYHEERYEERDVTISQQTLL